MTTMSNSSLVQYTRISPNRTANRTHAIDTITIHCTVGQVSVETLGNIFAKPTARASSNYGIGFDGRIGMYVEEKDRSWCSSNAANDHRAITIEVASDKSHPYAVNNMAYASLIKLLADICKRNGIKKLLWKGNKSLIGQIDQQNMTAHRWFASKACPGDWLYSRFGEIAAAVNALLPAETPAEKPSASNATTKNTVPSQPITPGAVVKLAQDAVYYNGKDIPAWVKNTNWIVSSMSGDRVVINSSQDGKYKINSPVNIRFLSVVSNTNKLAEAQKTSAFTPYKVRVTTNALNIRSAPGTKNTIVGRIRDKGVYTIVAESSGSGAKKWGLLKSYRNGRNGWISLDYTKRV